eukprot:COSAG01_NODE_6210_length_3793_cov_4.055495_2_plen_115_part_00
MGILSRNPAMKIICKHLDTHVDEERVFDLQLLSTADFNKLRDLADMCMRRHVDRKRAQRRRPNKRQRGAAGRLHGATAREQLFQARAAELQRERYTARSSSGSDSDSDSDSNSD